MSERDAFLRAISANPDDDTTRLAFADWLQEHGEPDRAEFIRHHIEWCRRDVNAPADDELWLRLCVAWEASGLVNEAAFGECPDAYDRGLIAGTWFGPRTARERIEAAFNSGPIQVARFSSPTEDECKWLADAPFLARLRGLCYREDLGFRAAARPLLASPCFGDLELLHLYEESPDYARELMRLLASATNLDRLTVLDLDGCHIGNEGLAMLTEAEHLRSVRKLTMGSCGRYKHDIGEPGLQALAMSRSLTGVTHLGCGDCELGPSSVHQLLQWSGVENLVELDLSFTRIGSAGVIELAESPRLKNLRRLCLDAFELTDRALEALATAPWLPHLRQLWIEAREYYGDYEEGASEEGLAAFVKRLGPQLCMPVAAEYKYGFQLSPINETERIWHRLRHCGHREKTDLNLASIL